jgi:signal transduction histidine kinase
MADKSELRGVLVFADLPDDQLDWFLDNSQELCVTGGGVYIHKGDLADRMFVILEGQFEWRGDLGEVVLSVKAGDVTGLLPFSRMKRFNENFRALVDGRVLRFPASLFPELVQKMPELTRRLVGFMSDRVREITRVEQQRDRLASLGKLSAGLAHELNNPASAAKRASSQLGDVLTRITNASVELASCGLSPEQKSEIENLEISLRRTDLVPPNVLTIKVLEDQINSLLRNHGQDDLWQLAAGLARRGIKPEAVESLFAKLDTDKVRTVLIKISASIEVSSLLHEIESSTTRISDLVGAIKEYTHMDQAPVQNVDVVKSLETTLTILNHKLKQGVTVQRDYQPVPLLVNSFGSELSQVWTNIIDNAIDAMHGTGELRVRTYRDYGGVVVEIGDNGPGIPADVQPHVFEPFFTTKGVGEGTGLGLDTVQRIVKKHRGNIRLSSKPGDTQFQVWLPSV